MSYLDFSQKLEVLLKEAKHGNTGTPREVAQKLHVSDKTVRRMVNILRESGIPIKYCRKSRNYFIIDEEN